MLCGSKDLNVKVIVSLTLSPTWRVTLELVTVWSVASLPPFMSDIVFHSVFCAILVISVINWPYSRSRTSLSDWINVPEAAWTASSRMRWSIFAISRLAPSTVSNIDIPSFEFLAACSIPPTTDRILSETARPAASSIAVLTRKPVERRSMAIFLSRSNLSNDAIVAELLVLSTVIFLTSQKFTENIVYKRSTWLATPDLLHLPWSGQPDLINYLL